MTLNASPVACSAARSADFSDARWSGRERERTRVSTSERCGVVWIKVILEKISEK